MDRLHLFEGYGIELEYMIVDSSSLDVKPVADEVLHSISGDYSGDAFLGEISWSNELVMHVIELKTHGPAGDIARLPELFQNNVAHINKILSTMDACLMPTAMHPWMNPFREMKLWKHEFNEVYAAFDKIFNCKGHGWANLQSVHINLPFYDDREFAKLHAAMRLVLPIMPALAASSPIADQQITGKLDHRLDVYRTNAAPVPLVAGKVVPEQAFSEKEYHEMILHPLYAQIAPHDPDGVLRYEWLNSRGLMARFDRGAIEIRVLDVQECPLADMSIASAIVATIHAFTEEFSASLERQKEWEVDPLYEIFLETIRDADHAIIRNQKYLDAFSFPEKGQCRASELWQHITETVIAKSPLYHEQFHDPVRKILSKGTLARRILRAVGNSYSEHDLREVYGSLTECLAKGKMFGV